MGYVGVKPSAVPLTSADITDGIITSAKIADGTIVNADINSSSAISLSKLSTTGTADATTFLRGDGAYTAVSSDFVKLATTTETGSASSVTFDGYFSSDYNVYLITLSSISLTASAYLRMRYQRSGSEVSASNYTQWCINHIVGGSQDNQSMTTGDGFYIDQGYPLDANDTTYAMSSEIFLHDPLGTNNRKRIHLRSTFYAIDVGSYYNLGTGFLNDNNNALSGIKFYTASGNINGKFTLYGLKK